MEYNFKPIFRSLLTSKQFQNEKCLKIWIWCLLKATDNPFNAMIGRQEIPLVRGQFIFGTLRAIEELRMSSSTIWFWLHWLEKEESVAIKSTNKFSIISISKQSKFDEILNDLLGNRKQTENKQKTTYNKDKKEKKDNNNSKELLDKSQKDNLIEFLIKKGMNKELIEKELSKFISYWTEKNVAGTKERWQMEKVFEIKRRLTTWFNNINKFERKQNDKRGYRI